MRCEVSEVPNSVTTSGCDQSPFCADEAEVAETDPDAVKTVDTIPLNMHLARLAEIKAQRDDFEHRAWESTSYWRQRWSKTDQEVTDLRREVRILEGIKAQMKNAGSSGEVQRWIDNEQAKLELESTKDQLQRSLRLQERPHGPVNALDLQQNMQQIDRLLSSLALEQSVEYCKPVLNVAGSPDLQSLVKRSFALQHRPEDVFSVEEYVFYSENVQPLLQTLIASALCEWIFDVDVSDLFFQSHEELLGVSSLYDRLWKLLAVRGKTSHLHGGCLSSNLDRS